jgi:hypothetical protein
MHFTKIMASLLVTVLGFGIAGAAVTEEVKVSEEGAKKFTLAPKIIEQDGKKVFATPPKSYKVYQLKNRIKVDPAKKYKISAKVKQLGENPARVYIGFIPYDGKGRVIDPKCGYNNTKGSLTTLTAGIAQGATSLTVKDASKWAKGNHYYVVFNAKEDMSDIPNFQFAGVITKIGKTGDVYTISFKKPIGKAYPAGTVVRQHQSGGTYIYTKTAKTTPKWEDWQGFVVQGKILRRATYLSPMIMIDARKEGSGAVFTDFIVEEL